MLVELGHWALWCAALIATLGSCNTPRTRAQTTTACLLCILLATTTLSHALMALDWSVRYVAEHTHSTLPLAYRFAALWSAHEGSMLLWVLVCSLWCWALVHHHNHRLPEELLTWATRFALWLLAAFLFFVLLTSNPFERLLPIPPQEGLDLNPLLQDAALMIHPPLLYLGYLGFLLPCALAAAALKTPQWRNQAMEAMTPWTRLSWAFLTLGIALGSFWAYYELGWGGWWFWDPVENASLMPWLCGLLLMHSNKHARNHPAWVLFLALLTFSFSVMGTFLVRSGVISSVHSFASDSTRGLWLLLIWTILSVTTLSAWLVRLKQGHLQGHKGSAQLTTWVAFETLLFLMLVVIAAGTLYPLLHEALYQEELSVGAPYFNEALRPFAMLLLVGMGVVPFWSTKKTHLLGLAGALLGVLLLQGSAQAVWWTLLAWTALMHLTHLAQKQRLWMMLGHLGLFVSLTGMSLDAFYATHKVAHMSVGEQLVVAGAPVRLIAVWDEPGEAFDTQKAELQVGPYVMRPERRAYHARGIMTSEVALKATLTHDWYVALGGTTDEGRLMVRIQKHPGVRLIWLGALVMALGALGACCATRKRP